MNPSSLLIGVLGAKGGAGKSVFAANFAIALRADTQKSVLLLDVDARSAGDQNIITGLKPVKTLKELSEFQGSVNAQTLPSLVARHPSGICYVGAVRGPHESLDLSSDLGIKAINNLRSAFQIIVCDLGSHMGDLQAAILKEVTLAIIVSGSDIISINQVQRFLSEMLSTGLPSEIFMVALNQYQRGQPSPQSIQQNLGRSILGVLPFDEVTSNAALQRGQPAVLLSPKSPLAMAYTDISRKLVTSNVLTKLSQIAKNSNVQIKTATASRVEIKGGQSNLQGPSKADSLSPKTLLKMRVHNGLITAMDLKKGVTDTKGDPAKERALAQKTQATISQILDKEAPSLGREERSQIIKEVLDEALGLGPLEDLLADDQVTEIMVNGPSRIFVEKSGRITLTTVTFTSNLQLRNVIERIVTPLGRRIDEKNPYVDARLKDGSRVNAVIEPIAIDGPSITIRKFAKKKITPKDYVAWNSMTESMIDFLRVCVENGLNLIVSGGTGSGKTTLLNVLSSFIPVTERIITVEDAAELQLSQEHVVRLETRPANMEGTGSITIRDLVRNSLRMRPDRIVVGECRGGEALDMLSAMNTGHDGSMTTVHANSPREAIGRLETLCLMAGMDLPAKAIREQIAGAVDLIVQISRLSDGSRKIISITEVIGMQGESVTLQEIFRFKETGFDKNRKIVGQFQAMGLIPSFIEEFERKGIRVPRSLFTSQGASSPAKKGA